MNKGPQKYFLTTKHIHDKTWEARARMLYKDGVSYQVSMYRGTEWDASAEAEEELRMVLQAIGRSDEKLGTTRPRRVIRES